MKNQFKLFHNSFQQASSYILFGALLFNSFAIAGQTRIAKKTAAPKIENTISAPVKSVMSAAWNSGELPAPLPISTENQDEAIAVLAQKVAAKNAESVPALLAALQLAGFFVIDKNGQVSHAPADFKGQGLAINGWEIAAAARMYGDRRILNLAEFDAQLMSVPFLRNTPAETGQSIAANLIAGVKVHADNTENKFLRNWARFIIELGKNSNDKYDLTNVSQIGQINLDTIQHLLITQRLYGDLWATAEKFKAVSGSKFQVSGSGSQRGNSSDFQIVKTSFESPQQKINKNSANLKPETSNLKPLSDEPKPSERCRVEGNTPTILDGIAATLGFGWDTWLGRLENSKDDLIKKAGSKYLAFTTAANILLVYAKFIHTYAALETTITAEDSAPLIRTKNTIAGARKKLKAFVRMNIGEWQTYQCLRTAMNIMTGLDFSTMNDGPLPDVGVQWGLTQGGAGDFYSNGGGINQDGEQIVGFTAENPKRIQDEGVGAGKGLKNLTFNKTDANGMTEIILEGTPQRNAKIGKLNQIRKQARVTTAIKIKSGEIKGDAVDVYGQWLAGIPGLISMPAELLYRTSWAASGALIVPVIDWEECTGDWSGTITYTRIHKFNRTKTDRLVSNRGDSTVSNEIDNEYTAKFNVIGSEATATVSVRTKYLETRDVWEMNGCRPMEAMRRMSCSFSSKQTASATGSGAAAVSIGVNRNAETYGLSFSTPIVSGSYNSDETGTCSGQCVPKRVKPRNLKYISNFESQGFTVPPQKLSASNALVLADSYSAEIAPGVTVTVSWNLHQCGSQASLQNIETNRKSDETAIVSRDFFPSPTNDFLIFDKFSNAASCS